ncbi:glycosyltransferase family 4 protein [Variovorax sp. VNK109]|uniref:glycosyltransferase family 4 protein n=1 Tax=Variovorax sp. VNK109 TaxID=3400919 RepID=UPI003C11CC9C
MKVLFIHQNFPGQFRHLAPALAQQGHEVVALGVSALSPAMPGVRHVVHAPKGYPKSVTQGVDDKMNEYLSKYARGESAAQAMQKIRSEGFEPDVVFAHPGWGEAIFAREVFPKARHLMYAEYYYGSDSGDVGFDPEFSSANEVSRKRVRIKNTHLLQAMEASDAGLSPTKFQRDQHPAWFRDRITVVHDGIDTARFRPDPKASVSLRSAGLVFRPGDEVITFVARELEPYRGYHVFMRALPELLAARPSAHVVIVGGDGVSYGGAPPAGTTWKETFWSSVADRVDRKRVHFVGRIPHEVLTQLMQVSAAHVYLTYPFVLSWSLMEAMSVGCLIIGSKTAPVEEVIRDGHNGILVDFFDPSALARTVADTLERRESLQHLRTNARKTIVDGYDLKQHCLPALIRFVTGEAAPATPAVKPAKPAKAASAVKPKSGSPKKA